LTTTKAIVVQWLKQEGDRVEKGEPVVELMTEKVSYVLDAPEQGTLLKIVAPANAEVPVGEPLGYIGQAEQEVPAR